MPWDTVLREAADAANSWQQELMEPALVYDRARGAEPVLVHQTLEPLGNATTKQDVANPKKPPRNKRGGYKPNAPGGDKGIEICDNFPRNKGGCREPCPHGRKHAGEGCGALGIRGIDCSCVKPPPAKKGKGGKGGKK